MIIFLYGEDDYSSRQKLNEIINKYKAKHKTCLNFIMIDFSEQDFDKLKTAAETSPMFKEKKLIVLMNAFRKSASWQKELAGYLKEKKTEKDGDIMMVFYEKQTPDKRVELFKFLTKKPNTSQEFKNLGGAKLENWIKQEVEKNNGKIEIMAVKKLAMFVGANLWQMKNEVEKLIAFRGDDAIKIEDIDVLVKAKIEPNIFETVDALSKRDKKEVLRLLHQHLSRGEKTEYLMAMFIRQFRNLLIIKDLIEKGIPYYGLAQKTGLHPFVVKKTFEQANNFTLENLKKIYNKLLDLEIAVKTGRTDSKTALDMLAMGV